MPNTELSPYIEKLTSGLNNELADDVTLDKSPIIK